MSDTQQPTPTSSPEPAQAERAPADGDAKEAAREALNASKEWFLKFGHPERLMVGGAAVAILGCILPWFGGVAVMGVSISLNGLEVWTGRFAFLACALLLLSVLRPTMFVRLMRKANLKDALLPTVRLAIAGLICLSALYWILTVGGKLGVFMTFLAGAAATFGAFMRFQK